MKIIKYLLLLVIVCLGAAPYGVSYLVEKKYKTMTAQLEKLYTGELKIELKFNRGYFTSTANATATNLINGQTMSFTDTIHNGPIIFDFKGWAIPSSYIPRGYKLAIVDTKISGPLAQMISSFYGDKEAYKITTEFEYTGSGITKIVIKPLQMSMGGADFEWKGATYDMTFNSDLTDFAGNGSIPLVAYTEGVNKFEIKSVEFDFDNNVDTMDSNFKFSIDNISATENGSVALSVKAVMFKGKSTIQDNLLSGDVDYYVAQIIFADEQYGPIDANLKVSNLNAKLANELSGDNAKIEEHDQKLLALLSAQPMLDLVLKGTLPQGGFNVKANGQVGGPELKDVSDDAIMKTMSVDADLKVAEAIIEFMLTKYVEQQVVTKEVMYFMQNRENKDAAANPYVMNVEELKAFTGTWIAKFTDFLKDKKYLIETGTDYIANIKYADSKLMINDVEFTDDDFDAVYSMSQVEIAPKAVEPTAVQESAPTSEMPATTDMQPMTEEEADQKVNAVPVAPAPAI